MAIVSPTPPVVPPVPGPGGLGAMLGIPGLGMDPRELATETIVQKVRPAISLVQDLLQFVAQNPEIEPIVFALLDAHRKGRAGGRGSRQQPSGLTPPMGVPGLVPMAPPALPPMAMLAGMMGRPGF